MLEVLSRLQDSVQINGTPTSKTQQLNGSETIGIRLVMTRQPIRGN